MTTKTVTQNFNTVEITSNPVALSNRQRLATGLLSLVIGSGLVFMVGLSNMAAAHDAAHDTRHAVGFPCH